MARPKREFTDEDLQKMYDYALSGCQNGTISTLMCIPLTTLIRRFGSVLREKRAERKYKIRQNQTNLSEHNPAMAIFLGKNELGQVDKQELRTETAPSIADITPEERIKLKEYSRVLQGLTIHGPLSQKRG